MLKNSKAFEQYCCVLKRNVVIEETSYRDGRKKYVCTMMPYCNECKNKILKAKFKTDE